MFQSLCEIEEDELLVDGDDSNEVPEFCVDIPRVLMTPTRVCVTGFQLEISNRVVRKFVQEEGFSRESFIRVMIGDENSGKLFSADTKDMRTSSSDPNKFSPAAERIQHLLLEGITINGKLYRFLAYSSSQLKEMSVWMVCPERNWTVQRMRDSMGDFSSCKTPSKYAARMGQCFSTTIETIPGGGHGVLRVDDKFPDIISDADMVHSNGVGLIRKELLSQLVTQLPFAPEDPHDVCAIQIRFGGAKGVLTAWEFDDLNNLRCLGYDICIRPSMNKFAVPRYETLEVVSISNAVPYYLNRSVILLLGLHGVKDNVFLKMQAEMLKSLDEMLTKPMFASGLLNNLSGPESSLISTLVHMLNNSSDPRREPFLFSCLHAIRAYHLMNLRQKARIYVPCGSVLIGGIDELGVLREGQVFLQVRRNPRGELDREGSFERVIGQVMVTKHPVMHPGDTRVLKAVDIPQLIGHKNVILFSKHGLRPEANKMSGSDLDGDQYAVTWDMSLVPPSNLTPMDYSVKKEQEEERINDESLLNHLINYARADTMGQIANLWLDHAVDKKDPGCENCRELAKWYAVAVDFPKSGEPAVIPTELKLPSSHPRAHWRDKKNSPSFHCDSILGQLYDQIQENSWKLTSGGFRVAIAGRKKDKWGQILMFGDPHDIRESKVNIYDLSVPARLGWGKDGDDQKLLDFADTERFRYEDRLVGLMKQFNIKCEGEIVTGCVLKYHKLNERRRHEVAQEIKRRFLAIRSDFRAQFFHAVKRLVDGGVDYFLLDEEENEEEFVDTSWIEEAAVTNASWKSLETRERSLARTFAKKLAASYYIACYSQQWHNAHTKSVTYSFPWIIAADVIDSGLVEQFERMSL